MVNNVVIVSGAEWSPYCNLPYVQSSLPSPATIGGPKGTQDVSTLHVICEQKLLLQILAARPSSSCYLLPWLPLTGQGACMV